MPNDDSAIEKKREDLILVESEVQALFRIVNRTESRRLREREEREESLSSPA